MLLGALVLLGPLTKGAADLPPEFTALRAKAESGNAVAQYNIGLAYLQGRDIPTDLAEAYVWLSLATENGSTGKALETLLGQMTPTQVTEGKRRLMLRRSNKATSSSGAPAVTHRPANSEGVAGVRLEAELAALRSEKAALAADLIRAREATAEANEQANAEAKALVAAKASAAANDEAAAKAAAEITALRAEITRLESASALQAGMTERIARLETELSRATHAVSQLSRQKQELEVGLSKAERAEAETRAKAVEIAGELEKHRGERGRAVAALAHSSQGLLALRENFAAPHTQSGAQNEQLPREIAQVERRTISSPIASSEGAFVIAPPARPGVVPMPSQLAPVPTPVAPPPTPRVHTVVAGDTLSKISRRYYGTATRWGDILAANADVLRNGNAVAVGALLKIP